MRLLLTRKDRCPGKPTLAQRIEANNPSRTRQLTHTFCHCGLHDIIKPYRPRWRLVITTTTTEKHCFTVASFSSASALRQAGGGGTQHKLGKSNEKRGRVFGSGVFYPHSHSLSTKDTRAYRFFIPSGRVEERVHPTHIRNEGVPMLQVMEMGSKSFT